MKSRVLLESHLKSLKLPTFVREYERTARQCAQEDMDYAEAREERHLQRLENHIFKRHLIIVDELGYVPLGQGAAENPFNFISRCYERTSLIVTTNRPSASGRRCWATNGWPGPCWTA